MEAHQYLANDEMVMDMPAGRRSDVTAAVNAVIGADQAETEMAAKESRNAFTTKELEGEFVAAAPAEYFEAALNAGFDQVTARNMSLAHAGNQERQARAFDEAFADHMAADLAERQAITSNNNYAVLQNLQQYGGYELVSEHFRRQAAMGFMDRDELDSWMTRLGKARDKLPDQYRVEFQAIDSLIASLEPVYKEVGDTQLLRRRDSEQTVSLDMIREELTSALWDAITNGLDIPGPDGEGRQFIPTPFRAAAGDQAVPGGAMTFIQNEALRILDQYEVPGWFRDQLPKPQRGLLEPAEGEYRPEAVFPPMAIRGQLSRGRQIIDQVNPAALGDFEALRDPESRARFAVGQLPLESYGVDEPLQDLEQKKIRNAMALREYQQANVIADAIVDERTGAFAVQLVPNGTWYPVVMPSGSLPRLLDELNGNLAELARFESELGVAEDGGLQPHYDVAVPGTEETVSATSAVVGAMDRAARVAASGLNAAASWLGTQLERSLYGADWYSDWWERRADELDTVRLTPEGERTLRDAKDLVLDFGAGIAEDFRAEAAGTGPSPGGAVEIPDGS